MTFHDANKNRLEVGMRVRSAFTDTLNPDDCGTIIALDDFVDYDYEDDGYVQTAWPYVEVKYDNGEVEKHTVHSMYWTYECTEMITDELEVMI